MKEIVLGALNELKADLLEIGRLRFEANNDDQHTFNALALRVGNIAELVKHYFELTDESAKNAVRWKFLFQTQGVSVSCKDGVYTATKDVVNGGQIIGKRLLFEGESLPRGVDKFLGF